MKLTDEKRSQLEEVTRGQSSSDSWHVEHCGRITASMIHRVVTRRRSTEPDTLVRDILKYKQSKPLGANDPRRHGHSLEPEARQMYIDLHPDVTVKECGMFVDTEYGYLGASPDGIIEGTNNRTVLEIKCPKSSLPVNAIARQDKNFFLATSDSTLHLKKTHAYYSQIQMQMALTGCTQADFFVYTKNESGPSYFLQTVPFDAQFWSVALKRAQFFFKNYVALELLTKRVQRHVRLVPR